MSEAQWNLIEEWYAEEGEDFFQTEIWNSIIVKYVIIDFENLLSRR